ncbi:MAG: hypothetical protein NT099_02790 [Candidatus Saganbacteria bacterium]|nr:hypothetical protein [Candidatus Saganbacteria bacterium]
MPKATVSKKNKNRVAKTKEKIIDHLEGGQQILLKKSLDKITWVEVSTYLNRARIIFRVEDRLNLERSVSFSALTKTILQILDNKFINKEIKSYIPLFWLWSFWEKDPRVSSLLNTFLSKIVDINPRLKNYTIDQIALPRKKVPVYSVIDCCPEGRLYYKKNPSLMILPEKRECLSAWNIFIDREDYLSDPQYHLMMEEVLMALDGEKLPKKKGKQIPITQLFAAWRETFPKCLFEVKKIVTQQVLK